MSDGPRDYPTTAPARYRNGSIVVDAIRIDSSRLESCEQFVGGACTIRPGGGLVFATTAGPLRARVGDWLVRNAQGDYYTSGGDAFTVAFTLHDRQHHS
ncbi:hypothetical protein [Glycomyces sp. YM15]|uniref:hypothetical protein n=1 Tax=Glycomyces sp. YM15 TaxID=2800446 RepID=UPI0019662813|nr:hypothetical protein [Glycomyces sp. YM15]